MLFNEFMHGFNLPKSKQKLPSQIQRDAFSSWKIRLVHEGITVSIKWIPNLEYLHEILEQSIPYCFYRRWWCARNRTNTEHADGISHQWHRKQFFKWLNVVVVRKSTTDFYTNWELLVRYDRKDVTLTQKRRAMRHTHTHTLLSPPVQSVGRTHAFVYYLSIADDMPHERECARMDGAYNTANKLTAFFN